MENKKNAAIIIFICLILVLGVLSIQQCQNNKSLRIENSNLADKNEQNEEKIGNQDIKINKLSIQAEFNEQRIAQLESIVLEKDRDIAEGKNKIDLLEKEKNDLVNELTAFANSGASPRVKEHIARLTKELESERRRLTELNNERNELAEKFNSLQRTKIDLEEELTILKNSTIPTLQHENSVLRENLGTVRKSLALMNLRADVKNLSSYPHLNRFEFDIVFSEEDISRLRLSGIAKISIVPTVTNRGTGVIFVQRKQGELNNLHKMNVAEIKQIERFVYEIESPNLSNRYNRKNSVNYEKGDEMLLLVTIPELNNLIIVRHEFKMK